MAVQLWLTIEISFQKQRKKGSMTKFASRYGGYHKFADTDDYACFDLTIPIWLEPHPHVKGLQLMLFRITRHFCQSQDIWFSNSWMSKYYQKHGSKRLKPYQSFMLYDEIYITLEKPVWLPAQCIISGSG